MGVFAFLATGALAAALPATPARTPVISVSLKTPRVGALVTIAVPTAATCNRVVATSPSRSQYPIPLTRRAGVCRGTFRFRDEGRWTLRFGRVSKVVRVLVALPTPHPNGAALGRPGCSPASPITARRPGPTEAFGTTTNGQLWRCSCPATRHWRATPKSFEGTAGTDLKLVLKRTLGQAATTAIAPDGTQRQPTWQQGHGTSSWERAGNEWGTGWQITEPGCWRIHVGSATTGADLWFKVVN